MFQSGKFTTLRTFFSITVFGAAVVGCASSSVVRAPEDVVRERAAERAEAFVKGDLPRSYTFMSPTYRKLRTQDAYIQGQGGQLRWDRAQVKTVACKAERCTVNVSVGVRPLVAGRIAPEVTVQFDETWLLEEGNWWLHQD